VAEAGNRPGPCRLTWASERRCAKNAPTSALLAPASAKDKGMTELVFEVTQEADGGYCAECFTPAIFTQADTWDELRAGMREAFALTSLMGSCPSASVCTLSGTMSLRRCKDTPRYGWRGIGGVPLPTLGML